jgi:hypothetical protein
LVTSAGHGIVAGLVAAAVLLVDDASLELVVGAAVDDVDDDVDEVVEEDDVDGDVEVGVADVVEDATVVVVEDGFGGAKGVSAGGVPDGPCITLAAAAVTPPRIKALANATPANL